MMNLILPLLAVTERVDFLNSIGKIYVVVIVILVLFAGIISFLFRLDQKISQIENQIKNDE
jgi:uncharacterized membrane protein YkvI